MPLLCWMVDLTWKHLPFLLSQRCLWHFWDSFQLVLGQYKWNLNTLLCLFFSASFYYKLFPPNTFKGVVPKCMCELFVCQNWEKWWRIRNVLVLNMQYQQILQFNSTQKSETLCILAPVTLTVPPSGHSCELTLMTSPQRQSLSGSAILRYSF